MSSSLRKSIVLATLLTIIAPFFPLVSASGVVDFVVKIAENPKQRTSSRLIFFMFECVLFEFQIYISFVNHLLTFLSFDKSRIHAFSKVNSSLPTTFISISAS